MGEMVASGILANLKYCLFCHSKEDTFKRKIHKLAHCY